jgi:hypothetical protein
MHFVAVAAGGIRPALFSSGPSSPSFFFFFFFFNMQALGKPFVKAAMTYIAVTIIVFFYLSSHARLFNNNHLKTAQE